MSQLGAPEGWTDSGRGRRGVGTSSVAHRETRTGPAPPPVPRRAEAGGALRDRSRRLGSVRVVTRGVVVTFGADRTPPTAARAALPGQTVRTRMRITDSIASRRRGVPSPHDGILEHYRAFWGAERIEEVHWTPEHTASRLPRLSHRQNPAAAVDEPWVFASIGAWRATGGEPHGFEFVAVSRGQSARVTQRLAMVAYHHAGRPENRLAAAHTLPIGEGWIEGSTLESVLVSLPYIWPATRALPAPGPAHPSRVAAAHHARRAPGRARARGGRAGVPPRGGTRQLPRCLPEVRRLNALHTVELTRRPVSLDACLLRGHGDLPTPRTLRECGRRNSELSSSCSNAARVAPWFPAVLVFSERRRTRTGRTTFGCA